MQETCNQKQKTRLCFYFTLLTEGVEWTRSIHLFNPTPFIKSYNNYKLLPDKSDPMSMASCHFLPRQDRPKVIN